MKFDDPLLERELAAIAKRFRKEAGKSRAQAGREMRVSRPSIFHAEEKPAQSLLKLRIRMIEAYSPFKVEGAYFFLKTKKSCGMAKDRRMSSKG